MNTAVKSGLNVKCNFILGFPSDHWKNIFETFWALVRAAAAGIHDVSVFIFVPYPGSELFVQVQKAGKIPQMDDEYFYRLASYGDVTQTYSFCPALSKEQLLVSRVFATFLFYGCSWLFRPWRPIRTAYNIISGHLESRGEFALRGFLRRMFKWTKFKKEVVGPVSEHA
jgi:anaerobic magnesium-protoporphyrin IX monomethyl ester cyclase